MPGDGGGWGGQAGRLGRVGPRRVGGVAASRRDDLRGDARRLEPPARCTTPQPHHYIPAPTDRPALRRVHRCLALAVAGRAPRYLGRPGTLGTLDGALLPGFDRPTCPSVPPPSTFPLRSTSSSVDSSPNTGTTRPSRSRSSLPRGSSQGSTPAVRSMPPGWAPACVAWASNHGPPGVVPCPPSQPRCPPAFSHGHSISRRTPQSAGSGQPAGTGTATPPNWSGGGDRGT